MSVAQQAPKANPENLLGIIQDAYDAKIVVPEFQRSFVWARDDIEELFVSILQGYFVGTFLMLDTQTSAPMFPFRAVEGLDKVNPGARAGNHTTVRLILDGQQRITSVFYALYEPDIPLKWAQYPHKFYLLFEEVLAGALDEAVVGVSTRDRNRMAEVQRLVQSERAVPLSALRDPSTFLEWLYDKQTTWKGNDRKAIQAIYQRFQSYMVPVVGLLQETDKDSVVNIFERINRTGVTLSLFDLAGARLYLKGVNLRKLWHKFTSANERAAAVVKPEFVLKVIAVLQDKEPRKGNLLDVIDALNDKAFAKYWDEATNALVAAYERVTTLYGALHQEWIPYTTMLVPLAALLRELNTLKAGAAEYEKLDRWYWASVFAQHYDSAVDTKTYQDLREFRRWMRDGVPPQWIERANLQDLYLEVNESRSAIYRGLMCLIVRRGARDFLTGQPANLHQCQDDHIFPRAVYGKIHPVDIILNRTLISEHTNKAKQNKRPSAFLDECLLGHGGDETKLLSTLNSHFISPAAYRALRADDFVNFVGERRLEFSRAVQAHLS